MSEKIINEKLIQKFLFGELPENECIEFEENFLLDAELFEQIKAFEDDLIEKYVRGWMTSAEKSSFEKNYLKTTQKREKVEFTRQLIEQIKNESLKGETLPTLSFWEQIETFFSKPQFAFATVFVVLFAIFGGWFLFQSLQNEKTDLAKIDNSNATETPMAVFTPTPNNSESGSEIKPPISTNDDEINSTISSNNSVKVPLPEKTKLKTAKTPEVKKTPVRKPAPTPFLALFAGTLRSEGKSNELTLPEKAKGAVLQLNLESVDYKAFQAELYDADGNVIYSKENLKPRRSKLNFYVPAKNLSKGDFIIKLFGTTEEGENQSVADFQFRVN